MTEKRVDNSWGSEGFAVLPESLRALWADEPLPDWVTSALKLEAGATAAALGQSVWLAADEKELSPRLRNFVLNLMAARRNEIKPVVVFKRPLPYRLNIRELEFSTRTRNCLAFGGLPFEPEELSK